MNIEMMEKAIKEKKNYSEGNLKIEIEYSSLISTLKAWIKEELVFDGYLYGGCFNPYDFLKPLHPIPFLEGAEVDGEAFPWLISELYDLDDVV